jgi:excisionase family DNA binding protein
MSTALLDPIAPSERDAELAKESSRRLSPYTKGNLKVEIPRKGKDAETIELPGVAVRLLARLLAEMAAGNAVTLVPHHAEVTTQQAADFLNVSRPFLIKQLLETGQVPHRKVGAHRRILFSDLLAFKRKTTEDQARALDELVAQAQEHKMGY